MCYDMISICLNILDDNTSQRFLFYKLLSLLHQSCPHWVFTFLCIKIIYFDALSNPCISSFRLLNFHSSYFLFVRYVTGVSTRVWSCTRSSGGDWSLPLLCMLASFIFFRMLSFRYCAISVCVFMYLNVHMCVIYTCINVCMYVCVYVCVHVCVY